MIAPKISIITVVFNSEKLIEATINSVLEQTYSNIEYLIIDGYSKDSTVSIIKKYAVRLAYWISEPDKGLYDAMNKGVALARGEWILFLNSGDMFVGSDILERVAKVASSCDADILLGDAVVLYPDGTDRLQKAVRPEEIPYGMICSHQSMLVRRSFLLSLPFIIGKMRSDTLLPIGLADRTGWLIKTASDPHPNVSHEEDRYAILPTMKPHIAVWFATNS